jgi:EAL domain-containing protein (putative c-di-GMP-specific phosphodiesterase class I)
MEGVRAVPRWWALAAAVFAAAWLFTVPGIALAQTASPTPQDAGAPTNGECVVCHALPQVVDRPDGINRGLYVTQARIQDSVHESLTCTDCHSPYTATGHPANDRAASACADCHEDAAAQWAKAGHELGVSVNIPYRLLDDAQFAEGLGSLLRSYDLVTQRITLEVVPAGPSAGAQVDADILARFHALGVRLSLDDAGRAASFAALRVLPLDELKIDVGFVHGLGKSTADAALVRGIIDIGHALGLEVVAEGVETRDAWNALADWGCDRAQGFYVATPRTPDELVKWLGVSWPAVA